MWWLRNTAKPSRIQIDNGAAMTSTAAVEWCERHNILTAFIQAGKRNQNAYIELVNPSFGYEVLNANLVITMGEVREIV